MPFWRNISLKHRGVVSLPVGFEFVVRVLGIDPGTVAMGYGIVESTNEEVALVDCGALDCPVRSPIGERLSLLYHGLEQIISRYQPDAVAVEQPFVITGPVPRSRFRRWSASSSVYPRCPGPPMPLMPWR
jgi:hypothetical protein